MPADPADAWFAALGAAQLLAVDPAGLGGAVVRAPAGAARDAWLACLRALLPDGTPVRRAAPDLADGRLLGGLDLPATLRAGRPVIERGLLAEADGGLVVLPMAERASTATGARIAAVMEAGAVLLERDGLAGRLPTRFGLVLLDEGEGDDEQPPAVLLDRLAFRIDLTATPPRSAIVPPPEPAQVRAARERLREVYADDASLEALCATALGLGVWSLRAPLLALRAARAAAALAGRTTLVPDDVTLAAQLVLAPQATLAPPSGEPPPPAEAPADAGEDAPPPDEAPETADADATRALEDVVLEAAQAAIPAGLLAQLQHAGGGGRARSSGKSGQVRSGSLRGRPAGTRRGTPGAGARLNVVETLRAAAPWQPLRRRGGARAARIDVRPDDFRVTRYRQRAQTTTIFVVDASGSAALHRLAEAKGAVELLLADCYVRRDRVALVAFRGAGAEILLPPTRSLVRAKRGLAALAGGGATPLAAGIDAAVALADPIRRRGDTPIVIVLTDGRANIARDGTQGRERAGTDALAAAAQLRAAGCTALLVDTAPRPQPAAAQLARAMGARYLALPHADATTLSRAVQAAGAG